MSELESLIRAFEHRNPGKGRVTAETDAWEKLTTAVGLILEQA